MELIQGVRTKIVLVSATHGAVRVPLAQSLNYTPKLTERNINEFDNLEVAEVVTTFDGVDISFDYLDSESKLVDACFADADPAADIIVDDPSNYQYVNLFANAKGLNSGKIVASILAKACRAKGSPYTEPVKEEARITRDLSATNVIKVKGAAILYTRIHLATGFSGYSQVIPPNAYADTGCSGLSGEYVPFTKTLIPFSGTSGYDMWVVKNGNETTTGYTMSSSGFVLGDVLGANDIWEVFGVYKDV